jgi:AraC-like DNA-binding protein
MKDGEVFSAEHGDIVYIPSGKEYVLTINERDERYGCTYGINFLIFDEQNQRLILKNNKVIQYSDTKRMLDMFKEMSNISESGLRSYAQLQAGFYGIIVALSENVKNKDINRYSVIEAGIRYLENDPVLQKSIKEIATLSNVSHNYFCRLFKEYSGITPQEYILKAKIEKAKVALKETNLSVCEVAMQCGFQDASYFSRIFKRKTGITPLNYKKVRESEE